MVAASRRWRTCASRLRQRHARGGAHVVGVEDRASTAPMRRCPRRQHRRDTLSPGNSHGMPAPRRQRRACLTPAPDRRSTVQKRCSFEDTPTATTRTEVKDLAMQRQGMKDLMFVKLQVAYAWVVHAYVHTRHGETRATACVQSDHAGRSAVRRTHPAGGTRPAGEAPRAASRGPGGNPRREEERVRCGGALDGQHTRCLPCPAAARVPRRAQGSELTAAAMTWRSPREGACPVV